MIDKKIAIDNLITLRDILESENINWWLTDGTLLGLYREGDFIKHDTDTDIGIEWTTFTKSALRKILDKGFKIQHMFGLWKNSFEITLEKSGLRTDFFFFYTEGDRYYHSSFDHFTQVGCIRYDYDYKPFGTKWTKFLGEDFKIPEDPLLFIETKYGFEWRTPIKQWHWSTSPKNFIKTNEYITYTESKIKFEEWLKS